jgi:hypothetical protein
LGERTFVERSPGELIDVLSSSHNDTSRALVLQYITVLALHERARDVLRGLGSSERLTGLCEETSAMVFPEMDPLLAPAQRALVVMDDTYVFSASKDMEHLLYELSRIHLYAPTRNALKGKLRDDMYLLVSYSEYVVHLVSRNDGHQHSSPGNLPCNSTLYSVYLK